MLRRINRLNQSWEFAKIYKEGRLYQGNYFGVSCLFEQDSSKMGVIVSNKVALSSVERNKIKRIVRDVFSISLADFKNTYFVVLAHKKAKGAETNLLREDLEQILVRLRENPSFRFGGFTPRDEESEGF